MRSKQSENRRLEPLVRQELEIISELREQVDDLRHTLLTARPHAELPPHQRIRPFRRLSSTGRPTR